MKHIEQRLYLRLLYYFENKADLILKMDPALSLSPVVPTLVKMLSKLSNLSKTIITHIT